VAADRSGGRRPERAGAAERRDRDRLAETAAPKVPDNITEEQLSREARAELRGLPQDLAAAVGRYLVAAELAKDPEVAYRYAQAARKLAARIGVVREVSGITAYRTSRWAEALAELRAARRMTGRGEYLPLMADSERALGRLGRALELVHSDEARRLPRQTQIELRIVESGIRRDQGLTDAAVLALQVPEISDGRLRPWSARLFYAYGDALLAAGRRGEARDAFAHAAGADENEETDALERLEQLDGVTVSDLEEDDEDDDFDDDEDDEDDDDDFEDAELDEDDEFEDAAGDEDSGDETPDND
jgi:predicted negative regulator of RcsB-dependent stress response